MRSRRHNVQQNISLALGNSFLDFTALTTLILRHQLNGKTDEEVKDLIADTRENILRLFSDNRSLCIKACQFLKTRNNMGLWKKTLDHLINGSGITPLSVLEDLYENTEFFSAVADHAYEEFEGYNFGRAKELFSFLATTYPRCFKSYLLLALIEEKMGNLQGASELYDAVIPAFQEPEMHFCAANFYWKQGDRDKCVALLSEANELLQAKTELADEDVELQHNIIALLKEIQS